eukprot:TRINITY_DN4084_c2_g1_i1.p2 TRINITY_DN4084_c2_g1~~TRINITY_DN4084_c2_g1_i1.p2  ORF type:complete len:450 (+),score=190.00 TRINITY_DN4084_c2_g1_i1:45-1352(+)
MIVDARAVELFREYLKFKTVSQEGHRTGANEACFAFLQNLCNEIGLTTQRVEGTHPNKPVLLATWQGQDEAAPSLLLNSHYDVVPVIDKHWTRPAWEGHMEENAEYPFGPRIYGRGAQDMKCVGIQYLVAISRLRAEGFVPPRNVYLSYVPDEEVGGPGMHHFVSTDTFKSLNVECALDEGLSNPTSDRYTVFYGERTPWWVEVKANGPTGHGSRFIQGTATNCLHAWLARALEFRKQQEKELHGNDTHGCGHAKCKKLGDLTTVNLTVMRAGVTMDNGESFAVNVIPTEAMAALDVRVPLSMPHADLAAMFTRWCREAEQEWGAAEGSLSWGQAPYGGKALTSHHETAVDETNKYWLAFQGAVEGEGKVTLDKEVFPAATDSRFLRQLGISALGFSPIKDDPILLHEHDEYLSRDVYVEGCKVYERVIKAVSSA